MALALLGFGDLARAHATPAPTHKCPLAPVHSENAEPLSHSHDPTETPGNTNNTSSPSLSPSPTYSPTILPSARPTAIPSNQPTISLNPTASQSPTGGPQLLIASGNELAFENMEAIMDDNTTTLFEEIVLNYLCSHVNTIPSAVNVSFQAVRVTDQNLVNVAESFSTTALWVLFDVKAIVLIEDEDLFDFDAFLFHFFTMEDVQSDVLGMLGRASPVFHDPSQAPSGAPTDLPSIFPSTSPTRIPSVGDMDVPSSQPTVSSSPTRGAQFLIASGNEIAFENMDSIMVDNTTSYFEETALTFLTSHISTLPGAVNVSFQAVRVTDQSLIVDAERRHLSTATLWVQFDVAALVVIADEDVFDFVTFLANFWALEDVQIELLKLLGSASPVFQDRANDDKPPVTILTPTESVRGRSSASLGILLTVVGAVMGTGGIGLILRLKGNDKNERPDIATSVPSGDDMESVMEISMKPTEPDSDSQSKNSESMSASSSPRTDYLTIPQFRIDNESGTADLTEDSKSQCDKQTLDANVSLMFRPVFMTMESNIEIPSTPMTNYEPSQFSPLGVEVDDLGIRVPSITSSDTSEVNEKNLSRQLRRRFVSPSATSKVRDPSTQLQQIAPNTSSPPANVSKSQPLSENTRSENEGNKLSSLFLGSSLWMKRVWARQQENREKKDATLDLESNSRGLTDATLDLESDSRGLASENHQGNQSGAACGNEPTIETIFASGGLPPRPLSSPSISVVNEVAYLHPASKKSKRIREHVAALDSRGTIDIMYQKRSSGYFSDASEDGQ